MFGKDFLWGCASAATQIEGGAYEDGKGLSIWDQYGKEKRILYGHTPTFACDSYHRYKEDIQLIRELGVKVYRFSINWTRIVPNGYDGVINQKGIDYYNDVINEVLKAGLIPFVTLYHWDMPYEVYKKGGFLNREIADWFAFYARVIGDHFADRVKNFIVINEPQCCIGGLGGADRYVNYTAKEMLTMIHNLLLMNGKAAKILKSYEGVRVGLAPCGDGTIPYSENEADIEAAYRRFFGLDYHSAGSVSLFCDPVIFGEYPKEYYEIYKAEELPQIEPGDMDIIRCDVDFIGYNNYTSWIYRADKNERYGTRVEFDPNRVYTWGGKWPYAPEGMYWILKNLDRRYHLPLIVTENGTPCYDMVSADGRVHDPYRIEILRSYIGQAEKAKDEGVDLRGYFVWSILDNLEWYDGYTERFGLVHVDFNTFKRTPKDSYYWYRDFIRDSE